MRWASWCAEGQRPKRSRTMPELARGTGVNCQERLTFCLPYSRPKMPVAYQMPLLPRLMS